MEGVNWRFNLCPDFFLFKVKPLPPTHTLESYSKEHSKWYKLGERQSVMLKLLIARLLECMEGGHEPEGEGRLVSCFLGMKGSEVG